MGSLCVKEAKAQLLSLGWGPVKNEVPVPGFLLKWVPGFLLKMKVIAAANISVTIVTQDHMTDV